VIDGPNHKWQFAGLTNPPLQSDAHRKWASDLGYAPIKLLHLVRRALSRLHDLHEPSHKQFYPSHYSAFFGHSFFLFLPPAPPPPPSLNPLASSALSRAASILCRDTDQRAGGDGSPGNPLVRRPTHPRDRTLVLCGLARSSILDRRRLAWVICGSFLGW
jgi:hypothetical protein